MRNFAILATSALIVAVSLAVSGCCCCAFPAPPLPPVPGDVGPMDHHEITYSHAPAGNVTLDLDTEQAYLEVGPSDGPNVTVEIDTYAPEGRLDTMRRDVAFSEGNGSLGVMVKTWTERDEGVIRAEGLKRFEVRIGLPAGSKYQVTMDSMNSAINVTELDGSAVRIKTTNALVGIRGGDYESIDVATTNGAIFARYDANDSSFRTENALIDIDTAQSSGTLRASTTNGLLSVTLEEGTGFNVDASITNGIITTHDGVKIDGTETLTRLKGKTPGYTGDFLLELTGVNGNIRIGY